MQPTRQPRAFSLLEVIVALGLFAGSVTVIMLMLPSLSRHAAAASDRHLVQRLPSALKVELNRLAVPGMDALATQIPVMSGPLREGFALAADREGNRLQSLAYLPPGTDRLEADQEYFRLECWRYPDEPLRFDNQKGFLAVAVRVSWPYRLPGSETPTPEDSRNQILFTVSLTR
jgi:hypothetical protein